MSFCINCGHEIQDSFEYCTECGFRIVKEENTVKQINETDDIYITKKCYNCGEMMPDDAFYCLNCGVSFEPLEFDTVTPVRENIKNSNVNSRNKWVSFFLCLFFGWLGIHKFYEGKVFLGIMYMFSFGLFGIGVLIDLVILIFKTNPYEVKRK